MAAVLVLTLLFLAASRPADACSCRPERMPCEAAFQADDVFTADVTALRDTRERRIVTLRIERTWRANGSDALTDVVVVETGFGGGDCGYPFELGQRYLVYADRSSGAPGQLHVNSCSRTRRLTEAGEDLAYFATLEAGSSSSRIFGQLRSYDDSEPSPAVAGVTIELRSPNSLRTIVTDRGGRFEFLNVSAGAYDLTARVPDGLAPAASRGPILLSRGGCAEIDLTARWDGRLSGILVRQNATPAAAFEVEALRQGDRFPSNVIADETGSFTFAGLAPGEYVLGTNLVAPPSLERPYATATIRVGIAIGPGEHVSLGPIPAPEPLLAIPVTGTVRLPQGARPSDARVSLRPIWNDRPYVAMSLVVAEDGTYATVALDGVEYEITVMWQGGRYHAGWFVAGRSSPPDPLVVPTR